MPNFSFRETLSFFCSQLHAIAPEEDLAQEEVELVIDQWSYLITRGRIEGSLHIQCVLGLIIHPLQEANLKELATSNFLGVNTGGCTLALNAESSYISLHSHTTCRTTPQENWEWLHRTLCVAYEWKKQLMTWSAFAPLFTTDEEKNHDHPGTFPTHPKSTFYKA